MVAELEPETVRKLGLIRLLLGQAQEEADQAPPFSTVSINRLHDVVEMFLSLAAVQHNVAIPRDFAGYWQALESPLGRPLAYRAQMQRLNRIRVDLKHYGIEPALAEISASRAAVSGLLEDETPGLFGISLADISLSVFVSSGTARVLLDEAQAQWAAGNPTEAFADLSEAFDDVVNDYARRKLVRYRRSVFNTTRDMSSLSPQSRRVPFGKDADFDTAVIESLKALDFTLMIVGLGIDLRRYGKFKALMPNVVHVLSGNRLVHDMEWLARTEDDYKSCSHFVVSTALHLGEFDYDFDHWASSR